MKITTFAALVRCTLVTAVQPASDSLVVRVEGLTSWTGSALVAAHLIAARLAATLGSAYAAPHVGQGDLNSAHVSIEWGRGGSATEARAAIVRASEALLSQSPVGFIPGL